jgi:hypothetical protein
MLLVWAVAMGWLVFGELPDRVTLLGAGIVVGGGLYAIYRERRRKPAPLPPAGRTDWTGKTPNRNIGLPIM